MGSSSIAQDYDERVYWGSARPCARRLGTNSIFCCAIDMLRCSKICTVILFCLDVVCPVSILVCDASHLRRMHRRTAGGWLRERASAHAGAEPALATLSRARPATSPSPGPRAPRRRRWPRAGRSRAWRSGSVKSHWFSAMPMKSRMAGSVVQARRRAALVSSAGTPDCRKARMSLPAVIEFDGRQASPDRKPAPRLPASAAHRPAPVGRRKRLQRCRHGGPA